MGGPFWASKDEGAWSLIKGELEQGEDAYTAARREFEEETGGPVPDGAVIALGEIRQPSGKRISAWAIETRSDSEVEFDAARIESSTFSLEWPRGSGRTREYPEIDRAHWFDAALARRKLVKGQIAFIDQLERRLQEARVPPMRAGVGDG
jgi:predicted NUDIX family NTP pyrophosphohydrolase